MKVELLESEVELLKTMCGGAIGEPCRKLVLSIKRKMLLTGVSYMLSKETLALAATLSGAYADASDLPEPAEPPEKSNGHVDPTPVETELLSEREQLEARWQPNTNGDSYQGNRIKWETDFKSTPQTPLAKLEKGRPITYIEEDGTRRSAKFVRLNPKDKHKAIVMSSKMKKPYSIPARAVEITDLSRPSADPLPVQI